MLLFRFVFSDEASTWWVLGMDACVWHRISVAHSIRFITAYILSGETLNPVYLCSTSNRFKTKWPEEVFNHIRFYTLFSISRTVYWPNDLSPRKFFLVNRCPPKTYIPVITFPNLTYEGNFLAQITRWSSYRIRKYFSRYLSTLT